MRNARLGGIPSILRSRLALIALLGVFLIPVVTSSLRGLTHVLTCQEQSEQPFTINIPESGEPSILSSTVFERGKTNELCGGLLLNMRVGTAGPQHLRITLPIKNQTDYGWKGSVKLKLDKTAVPIAIGEIGPGRTESDTLVIKVDPGSSELNGSLLIGP